MKKILLATKGDYSLFARLYEKDNTLKEYVVAYGYNKESDSWCQGFYLQTLQGAMELFKEKTEPVDMTGVRICGIMSEYGNNDFGYWDGFQLTYEEELAIWQILSKHDTEGSSVRGTWNDVIDDIK